MRKALVFLVVGFCLMAFAQYKAPIKEFRQELNMIPPMPNPDLWAFGYNEVYADALWLRVIQDLHICENAKDGVAHQKGRSHEGWLCSRGWVYKMIDAITDLAPRWKLPYTIGATTLSILVDDKDGATAIFEKGLRRFPDDYNLLFRASYHFIWEEKRPEYAAELLTRAAKSGGPEWFFSLAGKLYSESGKASLAKAVVEDALRTAKTEEAKSRLESRLDEINETLRKEAMKKSP